MKNKDYIFSAQKLLYEVATHLQLVLMIAVSVRQMTELLHHCQTVRQIFRRHEIFGRFDTRMQVAHLKYVKHDIWNFLFLAQLHYS